MSEQGEKPEVLPGDLITRPGLYESRSQGVVEVRHWGRDGWVAQWGDKERIYFSDGTRTGLYPMPDPWQLLHWVGPLPATEPEPETTTGQLADASGRDVVRGLVLQVADLIEREEAEPEPVPQPETQPQPIQVREGLWRQADGGAVVVRPTIDSPSNSWKRDRGYVWSDGARLYLDNGRHSEHETTQYDLVEYLGPIQQQSESQPVPIQVREGRWKTRAGEIVSVSAMPTDDDNFSHAYPWWDGEVLTWANNGVFFSGYTADKDLVEYLGPIEQSEPEPESDEKIKRLQAAINERAELRGGDQTRAELQARIRELEAIKDTQADTAATEYTPPEGWRVLAVGERLRDGDVTVRRDGYQYPTERVGGWVGSNQRYIRPIEPEPQQVNDWPSVRDLRHELKTVQTQLGESRQPESESDADLRIRLLQQANDSQAETIGRLLSEARDLNMEIGGLERRLLERDARIRDLETMHAAAAQAVVDAGKQNDALRVQVRILQQEADKKNSRIEFLETLNAGNGAAIGDYRAKAEKLQGLVDTARGQLEAAATERDELRAAIDAADKQLDQKDAEVRDLRIELDAAQQVPQPVSDEERERIWDEATEQAGRQVVRWLRPLTLALHRQPDERFSRFMALTLSVLPDVLPELLGYAVGEEAGEE